MVLWLWNEQGAHRLEDPGFLPTFFLHASPAELPGIRRRTEILDGVREVREVERRIALEDDEAKPVLEIVPRHYRDIRELAHILDSNGGYVDHRLYNVDLRFSQRYAMDHGLFPMGLMRYSKGLWTPEEEHFALEYPLPPLKRALLDLHVDNPAGIPRFQDKLLGARIEDVDIDGSEESILKSIDELVRSKDPDVLMTDGGDAFVMPYLARKAAEVGVDMRLGRDPDKFAERKGKSYFTYGKIVYKPGQYILRGRLHLDRGHFAMRESDFAGLAELSRLSTLTPQEQARLTPGTAFTAMQTNLAYHDGCLVVWKKNRPEDFKDAEDLLRGDRGGFTFEPEVGVHEGLYELDFSSLYPSIMVKYNISAETLDCACCRLDGLPVPELRYHLCTRRVGIVGRVLKPLIERRRYYKKMKKEPGPLQDVYEGRDTILKWTLVTCFGAETFVPYRLNGEYRIDRIEDVVNRYLSGKSGIVECKDDLRVFSFDSDLHSQEKRVVKVMKALGPKELLKIEIEGKRELLVTPNHRFFIFNSTRQFKVCKAEELMRGDLVPVVAKDFHQRTARGFESGNPQKNDFEFLPIISIETVPYDRPYVYCFEVEDDLHGFVTANGAFVGQSFGYQGYKNARFGRIECHEAINAYARDILVRTMEIAESHGYEVVHGIVDSVWLRPKPNADPIEKVREHIAGSIGLPIELEGRYKWIVFLPCKTTGVGALNRYYGLFQDDEFKLRGIELRKHDTPEFINICQEAMLGELSLASTAAEFLERIPKAVDILRWTAKCVLDRTIPVHQFILTKSVSRTLTEYVVLTATAAALKQMEKRGFPVEPGESVRYVLMDARARDSERKVRVAEFLQGDEEPDAWEYIKLLARSGQTLLAPFGYTEDKLFAMCKDLSDLSIQSMPERAIAIQEDYKSAGESRSKARGGVGYKKPWRIVEEAPADEGAADV
jgi:DNA polymerase elongation subunit (family B)